MKRFLSFVLLFFSFVLKSQSQFESTVQGFVFDKANGEPIPFCNVFFKNTNLSASTDLNGFFNINRIVPGEYTLLITNFDFDTIIDHFSIKGSSIINKKFFFFEWGNCNPKVGLKSFCHAVKVRQNTYTTYIFYFKFWKLYIFM